MVLSVGAMAQQKIQLRSVDKAECERSDMSGLRASFSFATIDAQDYESERGTFSWLSLPNTIIGGNEGDPQIPVVNELIAVPFGANPRIEITSYSTTDYRLDDYGIKTLVPRQPSLRKDQRPEEVPFVYNESAYQTRGLRSAPSATVYVDGTMRGIQVGKMTIEPVSYDPVNNTLRVFNDIEVEVHFDGADTRATEAELLRTYTPYFDIIYQQLFNGRAVMDVYSSHPDLYTTPVKMIVITTSTYANNTTFQNWVKWKKQKGIYTTVYTTATTGTTSANIKSFIRNQYTSNAPTFVVIVGDTGDVTYSLSSSTTSKVTDLYYSSTTDSDLYPEMFLSRMPISSTTELTNLLNKIMTYEQYTMTNPSYLNESLLIAGWDSSWTSTVGKPTIQYANNYYFNSAHGITPRVFLTTGSGQTTCYNYINQVGFVNYTAHGDNTMWYDPQFTVSNVSSLTNNGKYFWAMGNCCLAANWGYSSTCFAEALLRAANKGAFGYIGSCPETYWYEDYYFGVGATSITNQMPTQAQTKTGCYDAMFDDTGFNTLNAVPFIGNLAVAYAHAGSYSYSTSDKYYWEAYHCLGDGSVMPYHKNPSANNVSHANILPFGTTSFTVSADAGSYVAITVNDEIIGVAQVPSNGTVNVPITAQTAPGTALIVVTRNQRQPYSATINIVGTQYTITATASPTNGGTVSGAGTYYEGTNCTLIATPNTGYSFANWKKNNSVVSTDATYTFEVTGNADYTATFNVIPQYTISASANPTAGGRVTGGGTYYENTQCTLTATANAHYEFTNWKKGNSVVSTDPAYTFTVTGAGSYVANFTALAPHSVTCNSVQNGTISANVTTAYKNEIVTLSATPASGYCFSAWDVRDASNNSIPVTDDKFTMPDSDVTVSATFVIGYNVTLATPMNGTISADPMGGPQGTTINLTATPALGYVFSSWVVYKTGDLNTIVTVNNNSFNLPAYDVTVVGIFTEPEGGDVTIGSGATTNSGNYVPTSVNYEYSLTQQIYTAAELGDAASIIAISFYYNSTNTSDARNLQVYMSHTSNSTLTDWTTVSSSQLVFAGTHTFTQGWNTLTLTTPFAYNGASNVLVTVDDNSGTYSANGYFRTYSTGANRALYYRNANTNPDPTGSVSVNANKIKYNAQMTVTKAIPSSEGYLCVSPNSLTGFDAIGGGSASESQSIAIIGANLQDNVTVTPPTGYEVSTTLSGSYANTLTLTSSDGSLMQTVYVRLASNLNAGDYNGDMTIVSGASSTTVSLSGTVAQGGPQYAITVTANPTEGGTVSGSGTYYENNSCTITAAASEGYTFTNWTKDGTEVSTDATYTFNVTEDAEYVANFTLNTYMVTVSVNPAGAGTITGDGTYNHGAQATLTATAASRYVFVNWTENGTEVSTNATYSFTVTEDVTLEANFEIPTVEFTVQLNSGWSWWSTNLEITLAQVEEAMGTSGLYIVSQTGDMASYYEGLGWDDGELEGIDLSKMYKISASAPVELVLNAPAADPSEYTITLNNGANWIGYPVQQSMDINEALADLTPASNDVIKSLNSFAMYSAGRWRGGLNTLEPGKGYVYTSKATGQKTFVYPSQSRSNAMLKKNIVPEDNVWVPMRSEFRDNMSVVAKVSFADMTTMDEETEVVAFVGDECRGSAKLMYMEDTGEYVAFLLVYGQDGELVSFKVYNDGETMDAAETVEMRSDAVVGDLDAPYALHSVGTMSLFPNPVSAGESVRMEMPANVELAGARVEVYNALGALLVNETLTNGDAEFRAMPVSGVYTVRVTDRKGNVHFGKLIVR